VAPNILFRFLREKFVSFSQGALNRSANNVKHSVFVDNIKEFINTAQESNFTGHGSRMQTREPQPAATFAYHALRFLISAWHFDLSLVVYSLATICGLVFAFDEFFSAG
jgi:hypothetical protein